MVPLNGTSDKSKNLSEAENSHKLAMLESCLRHKNQKEDSILGPILASTGGTYPQLRDKMAVERPLQTQSRPVLHPDSSNHAKPQQKKAMTGCSTGQLPQSLLSELSTFLNQTGRAPREPS